MTTSVLRPAPGRAAVLAGTRTRARSAAARDRPSAPPTAGAGLRPWRSPITWGLVLVFTGTSSNAFAMFAWLPPYLADQGVEAADAGVALFVYALTGLPLSFGVPLVVARMRNPYPLGLLFAASAAAGYAGLLLSPADGTLLWVLAASLVQGACPMALLLINLRTRTATGSAALSGASQGSATPSPRRAPSGWAWSWR